MQYQYIVIKEEWMEGDICRISYGAAVAAANEDGFQILESYRDLCMDKEIITHLIELCNSLKLAPEHFTEVIEDFLSEL